MDGVEHKIIPLVGAGVPGDDLGPPTDDHPIHVAFYQNVSVSVGHRRRVVVGPVPHQRTANSPGPPASHRRSGHRRQGQQGLQVPFHPLTYAL